MRSLIGCMLFVLFSSQLSAEAAEAELIIRQITHGPAHHFFGYIGHVGNTPWNGNGRHMVLLRSPIQDRMPEPGEAADIVLLDTEGDYAERKIEETRAWNPQQGTMLYWNPDAPDTQFFFNDRDPKTNRVFCSLYDIAEGRRIKEFRFDGTPMGNSGVAQSGGYFLGLNYGRMDRLRKVTGYAGAYDWTGDTVAPENDGIFKVNVHTGHKELLVSYSVLANQVRSIRPDVDKVPLFINHTLWSRDDQRILFYLRGNWDNGQPRINELFTMHADGGNVMRHETFLGGHPEWGTHHKIIGTWENKQVIYDADAKAILRELGSGNIFPSPGGDIALSPDARWFVNGYKHESENNYVIYDMDYCDHTTVRGLNRGTQFQGDVRLDPSPCWRRDGRAIAVPAIATDGTRQTFVIDLSALHEKKPVPPAARKSTTRLAPSPYSAIDIALFMDNIRHWQKKYGRDRNDPRFEADQIVAISDNLLRYQNPDGGWPKDLDWLADIPYAEVRRVRGHTVDRSTLDNHSTFSQVDYLARAYVQTGDDRYRAAVELAIDYILGKQDASGGWAGSDVYAITFNDEVMTGIMTVFLDIQQRAPHFKWLDDARRAAVSESLDRAVACTLACQIVVNGKKTAWCQQHDHKTLAPVGARSFELASICSRESASVLSFLMSLPDQDENLKEAIEAGVDWLRAVAIHNIRLDHVPIDPVRFENHTAAFDSVAVPVPDSESIWARYYDLEDNTPLFCGRDGKRVPQLADVELERRTGYAWYGDWPRLLLEVDLPAWQGRLARKK